MAITAIFSCTIPRLHAGFLDLEPGPGVNVSIQTNPKTGKPCAVDIELLEPIISPRQQDGEQHTCSSRRQRSSAGQNDSPDIVRRCRRGYCCRAGAAMRCRRKNGPSCGTCRRLRRRGRRVVRPKPTLLAANIGFREPLDASVAKDAGPRSALLSERGLTDLTSILGSVLGLHLPASPR